MKQVASAVNEKVVTHPLLHQVKVSSAFFSALKAAEPASISSWLVLLYLSAKDEFAVYSRSASTTASIVNGCCRRMEVTRSDKRRSVYRLLTVQ